MHMWMPSDKNLALQTDIGCVFPWVQISVWMDNINGFMLYVVQFVWEEKVNNT